MISWFITFAEEYLGTDDDAGETLEEIVGMLKDMEAIEKSSKVCPSAPHSGCVYIRTEACHTSVPLSERHMHLPAASKRSA